MSNHSYCQTFIEYTVTGGCKYVFDIKKDFNMLENGVHRVRKINRVNAIIAKFLTILKLQPNRATLRSDLTQAVR